MINRDLIRRKIVQLTYAYYQNSNYNMDNAEKELMFSLSKSYDLYNYMLQLIVAITGEARKRYDVEVVRAQREGLQEPSARLAFNEFAVQLEENKMLLDWIDVKHSNWDENIEVVRSLYNTITSSDLYADYVSGAFDAELPDMDDYDRDREWWRRVYKKFIQNNDEMDAFLEEKSLYWNDDKDIVTGHATYLDDFNVPGQLYGKTLRSPYPHAKILSIDATKALASGASSCAASSLIFARTSSGRRLPVKATNLAIVSVMRDTASACVMPLILLL